MPGEEGDGPFRLESVDALLGPGFAPDPGDHPLGKLGPLDARKMLVDEQAEAKAVGLADFVPVEVFGRAAPAVGRGGDFEAIVGVEENQADRLEGFEQTGKVVETLGGLVGEEVGERESPGKYTGLRGERNVTGAGRERCLESGEQLRIVISITVGVLRIVDTTAIATAIVLGQHPAKPDFQSGLAEAAQQSVFLVIVDITEVLVFHKVLGWLIVASTFY